MTQFKKNEADILWSPFDIPIEELGKDLLEREEFVENLYNLISTWEKKKALS